MLLFVPGGDADYAAVQTIDGKLVLAFPGKNLAEAFKDGKSFTDGAWHEVGFL